MPIYSYQCLNKDCEFEFDAYNLMKDNDSELCPKCQSSTERPVVSNAPIVRIWQPCVVNDLYSEPKLFESKTQLKKECKALGVSCGFID